MHDFRNGHLGAEGMQACHKCLMFWARQTMLNSNEHRRYVTPEQRCGIEPQTGEDFTAEHSLRIWHQPFVVPGAEDKPVDCLFQHTPHQIFAHATALVDLEFRVQVNTDAARGDLGDELRRILDIIIGADMCLATVGRIDEQYGVWLWFIVHVKSGRTIIAGLDSRGT